MIGSKHGNVAMLLQSHKVVCREGEAEAEEVAGGISMIRVDSGIDSNSYLMYE